MDSGDDWTREQLMKEYVGEMTPLTVPVNITIHGQQTILDLSSVEEILRSAKLIALQDCDCRIKMRKCDRPLDVCLTLDEHATEAIKDGARRISVAQALVVLHRSHNAGLVHMAYTFKGNEKPDVICSCCSCCCHSLSALVRFGIPDHVVASEYIAQQDETACDNCGICVERCQFKARQMDEDNKLVFNQARCFGCGLCASTCPRKAITLVKRYDTL